MKTWMNMHKGYFFGYLVGTIISLLVIAHQALGWDELPDRHKYCPSPTIGAEIHSLMERCRIMRIHEPDVEFRVQVWQDQNTYEFTFHIIRIEVVQIGNANRYVMVLIPKSPAAWPLTPYEYREKTGHAMVYSLGLQDYEWYYDRQDC